MMEAAEELGLDKKTAEILTKQTAYGACRMALENNTPISKLRQNVTSPGGTTEAALKVLEENNIKKIFLSALAKATKRGEELALLAGE
jgi:pyrroline-5-carboxylate reductase